MNEASPAKIGIFKSILRFVLTRLLIFVIVLTLAVGGVQAVIAIEGKDWAAQYGDAFRYAGAAAVALIAIVVYVFLVRWLERRRPSELAILPGIPLAIAGAVLGFVLFSTVFAILWQMKVAHYEAFIGYAGLAPAIAMAISSAVGEEIIFRGGIFRVLEDGFGTLVALLLSSALFGLVHAGNPGATTLSTVAIALEAGLLLGAAYVATRSLWLPIGLHFGWNFTEGGVFGTSVSGSDFQGMAKTSFTGSDLLTGGKFGPEASVVAIAVCLAAGLVLAIIAIRAGRWKPLAFRLILP